MHIISIQVGARHHYAVPRLLEKHGVLEALYTDSCSRSFLGRLSCPASKVFAFPFLSTLSQRRPWGITPDKIRTTDLPMAARMVARATLRANPEAVFSKMFDRKLFRWGFRDASVIYSMFGEGYEFLLASKARGLKIAVEIFITPIAHRIVAAEQKSFPDWESPSLVSVNEIEAHVHKTLDIADCVICPSTSVLEGVCAYAESYRNKACIVPYGSGAKLSDRKNKPIPGRVLFAGTADLRKGIHYFAAASRLLSDSDAKCDFRVAGNVTETVRNRPECCKISFLGRIGRDAMIDEIMETDVLVLPTLAEGSASVISEALMAGVPVVTTASAGSSVRHEIDGLIVKERDASGLASAIERIVQDRDLRFQMAHRSSEQSSFLSETSWGERLVSALQSGLSQSFSD